MHTWGPLTSRFQVPPQLAESQLLQWGLCLVWVLTLPGDSYSDRLGDRTTELHTFYPKHRRRTEQKHKGVPSPVTKAENYWKTLALKDWAHLTPFYSCPVYSRDTSPWGHRPVAPDIHLEESESPNFKFSLVWVKAKFTLVCSLMGPIFSKLPLSKK